jgi:CheY-like chemotaxis protein
LELTCLVKSAIGPKHENLLIPEVKLPDLAPHFGPSIRSRLLLVEDEAIVGMFMEEVLEELGFEPTHPIASLAEAMTAAERERYDGAVLDMNLKGESVYPLAELLQTQNVPFVFVTGYGRNGIDERFAHVPVVQKPVTAEALAQVLFTRFGQRPPRETPGQQAAIA